MYIMSNANKNYKLILSKPKLKLPLEKYNHKKITLDFCLGIKMEYKLVHVVEKWNWVQSKLKNNHLQVWFTKIVILPVLQYFKFYLSLWKKIETDKFEKNFLGYLGIKMRI